MPHAYVSSTYLDLVDCRAAVCRQLRKMNVSVVGMEDYPASDERPLDLSLKGVAEADLYVGIIAWRYGFVPPAGNPDQRSITELEYREAGRLHKKRLIFMVPDTAPWPILYVEQGPGADSLRRLRDELRTNHVVDFFSAPAELAGMVSAAVHKALEDLADDTVAPRPRAADDTPHEVEHPAHDFTGRTQELRALRQAIHDGHWNAVGIFGTAGIGKTELAKKLIADVTDVYPDGQIYLDLKGPSDSPLSARAALSYSIEKLAPGTVLAAGLEELAKQWRSKLYGKRVIIFMDNVAQSDQIARQVPPPRSCLLVVTSRSQLNLPEMFPLNLDFFGKQDAADLLTKIEPRLGPAAAKIARLCGYLPFALGVAARAVRERRDLGVSQYVQALESNANDARLRLIDPVLKTSYDWLSSVELKQQWCGLACFEDPFPLAAAAGLWQLSSAAAFEAIGALLDRGMLFYRDVDHRYYLHDLARLFARAHLEAGQPYPQRHAAFFLRYAREHRHPLILLDSVAADVLAAYQWCGEESDRKALPLLATVGQVLESDARGAAEAVYLVARLLKRKGRAAEAKPLYEACLAAARESQVPSLEGKALRCLGELCADETAAEDLWNQALGVLRAASDIDSRKELIFALHLYADHCLARGRAEETERLAVESLKVRDQIAPPLRDPHAGLSNGATKLIAVRRRAGLVDEAYRLLLREKENLDGVDLASALGQVACSLRDCGRTTEAAPLLAEARRVYDSISNYAGSSWIKRCEGELHWRLGQAIAARQCYEEALAICRDHKLDAAQSAVSLLELGRFHYLAGNPVDGRRCVDEYRDLGGALDSAETTAQVNVAQQLTRLGQVLSDRRMHAEARTVLEDARAMYRKSGNAGGEAYGLQLLGNLMVSRKLWNAAEEFYREALRLRWLANDEGRAIAALKEIAQTYADAGRARDAARTRGLLRGLPRAEPRARAKRRASGQT